jgi:hypothetical protein
VTKYGDCGISINEWRPFEFPIIAKFYPHGISIYLTLGNEEGNILFHAGTLWATNIL